MTAEQPEKSNSVEFHLEVHDAHIELTGVLAELLIEKNVITREELEERIRKVIEVQPRLENAMQEVLPLALLRTGGLQRPG